LSRRLPGDWARGGADDQLRERRAPDHRAAREPARRIRLAGVTGFTTPQRAATVRERWRERTALATDESSASQPPKGGGSQIARGASEFRPFRAFNSRARVPGACAPGY